MSEKIKRHYRHSYFIPCVTPEELSDVHRWLMEQHHHATGPRRSFLARLVDDAATEMDWRSRRHLFEVQEHE